ncbi:MAG TPA: dienelactone hydrolase family protein [Thermoanaerobaculia bacterium]|nr:dienelactone hydrolase family protein [Thermoanaerobaculia bacterium]
MNEDAGTLAREARVADLKIPAGDVSLDAELRIPDGARGVVVFAHGAGSSRLSPRNRYVAETLRGHGLGTLLFDLLTHEEEEADFSTARLRFDIDLLAERLVRASGWLVEEIPHGMPFGYFGASTGAAAALVAAAYLGPEVAAVVSRGGRPDLAGDTLERVKSPTLLLVGGRDDLVLALNRSALERLSCEKRLEVVPGATHLFEEPGALAEVARRASEWFGEYFPRGTAGKERP